MFNPLLMTDGYKLGHHHQYPKGMTYLFSNFTARNNKNFKKIAVEQFSDDYIVVFGTSAVVKYITSVWDEYFFQQPKEKVVDEYKNIVSMFLNDPSFSVEHVSGLHDLGSLPLVFSTLKEGTLCKIGVPFFTVENTKPDFAWLVNYVETQISALLWKPITTATIARHYKKILNHFYDKTGANKDFMDFMVHDFSMRGMSSIQDSYFAGMGHLTSFCGSDNLPAICGVRDFYGHDVELEFLAGGVPATEHSVTSSNIRSIMEIDGVDNLEAEKRTILYLFEKYPSGLLSYVSDTYDYFGVLTEVLPSIKDAVLSREGKYVVRPDSGDPLEIICGTGLDDSPEGLGTLEILWNTFGGTINEDGYRVLDSHIGLIYGDSITPQRMYDILVKMEEMKFSAENVVFGVGSFTYQYLTRDTFGMAMKATYCEVNGVGVKLFKDPKTGDGTKKSAKGMLVVQMGELVDNLTYDEFQRLDNDFDMVLGTPYIDFTSIRKAVNDSI